MFATPFDRRPARLAIRSLGRWCALMVVVVSVGCEPSEIVATWKPPAGRRTGQSDHSASEVKSSVADDKPPFVPPFPDRHNPFRYQHTLSEVEVEVAAPESVLVLGFVNRGVPSVMLSIDGTTHTMSAGQTAGGIEVVGLSPPRVRLSSADRSWTASLFD